MNASVCRAYVEIDGQSFFDCEKPLGHTGEHMATTTASAVDKSQPHDVTITLRWPQS